jgi:hypothetical protein
MNAFALARFDDAEAGTVKRRVRIVGARLPAYEPTEYAGRPVQAD